MDIPALNYLRAILTPYICLGCGRTVNNKLSLCVRCTHALIETQATGATDSFIFHERDGLERQLFEKGLSLFYFLPNNISQRLVHVLKYNKQEQAGLLMSRLISIYAQRLNFFQGIDYLLPVPIHKTNQQKRGYNQSVILCKHITKFHKIPSTTKLLVREKKTKPQATLSSAIERKNNITQAFKINLPHQQWEGKHMLIVDDVLTTGSTINECAKTLHTHIANIKTSFLTFAITDI